jgi:hypothetical protein
MLRAIVRQALPGEEANAFAQRVAELRLAVAGDGGDALEAARALRTAIDGVVKRLAVRRFRPEDLRAMLSGLVDDGVAGDYRDYAGAEQATMAIASLLDYLARHGGLADVRRANSGLDRLYDAVKNDEKYRPERFREALADLQKAIVR